MPVTVWLKRLITDAQPVIWCRGSTGAEGWGLPELKLKGAALSARRGRAVRGGEVMGGSSHSLLEGRQRGAWQVQTAASQPVIHGAHLIHRPPVMICNPQPLPSMRLCKP